MFNSILFSNVLYGNMHYFGHNNLVNINDTDYSFIKGFLGTSCNYFQNSFFENGQIKPSVYLIKNFIANKIYVGSTGNSNQRINSHRLFIQKRKHSNVNLNNLLKEFDIKSFEVIVIFTETREEAYVLEQYLIDTLKPTGTLLNIGDDVRAAMLGKLHTAETKEKLSVFHKTDARAIEQHKTNLEAKKRKVSVYGAVYNSLKEAGDSSSYSHSFIRRKLIKNSNPNIFYLTDNASPLLGITLSDGRKKQLSEYRKTNLKAIAQLESIRDLNRKKILLNGVLYNSVLDAVKQTGIAESTLHRQLRYSNGKSGDTYVLNYLPSKSTRVLINDVIYENINVAIAETKLTKDTIKYGLKTGKFRRLVSE